jgi:transcriptional regulator with XRE-family HTH domain
VRRRARGLGVVSGYLLKMLREAVGTTQVQLAEQLAVDLATVQGWESGRRPLTAVSLSAVALLRTRMSRLGAPAWAVQLLPEALDADHFLGIAIEAGDRPLPPDDHPMAAFVLRRRLIEMILWPFSGTIPPKLSGLPMRARRGPVPDRPTVNATDRTRFFDHLLVTADSASGRAPLLYRQPLFLLSLDQRSGTSDWLRGQYHRALRRRGALGMNDWMVARSAAIALARQGDREPLAWFVRNHLVDELQATANLNYWAYWLGEIVDVQADDTYVTDVGSAWSGA